MPHLAPQFHLTLAPADYAGKPDGFRLSGTRGNIQVQAATVPTLLFGVNWYLKYVAHLNLSTDGSRLGAPGLQLPAVSTPILRPALYPFRYALNENTDGYTTPYWDLPRWQHEIDLLALSGFNAILIQRGNDLAVYRAFRDLGYTDPAIRRWITQPAHQNWQWMGNMCCFVEPIALSLMEQRAASARRILDQLRSLGITPVLPGFWGVVPADFATHAPGAHVVLQTNPWNGFERPGWLDPRDPAFDPPRRCLLPPSARALRRHHHLRHGDLPGGRRLRRRPRRRRRPRHPAGPQHRPSRRPLVHDGLAGQPPPRTHPRRRPLAHPHRRHRAGPHPARPPRGRLPGAHAGSSAACGSSAAAPPWALPSTTTPAACPSLAAQPGSHLAGTALFTEGIDTNPFAFDLYTEMAWRSQPVDLESWTADYALRRYGRPDPHAAAKAWRILLHTVYSYRADGNKDHGERDAAHESIFNAQPSLTATRTGHWAPDVLRYTAAHLRPALTELLQVAPALRSTASFRYDLTDLTRQVLANDARRLLPLIRTAYEARNVPAFHALTAEWMRDMQLEDGLLGTSPYFLLGRWLSYVPAWAATPADLPAIEYDARSILTTWGDRTASETDLHEYGNRDWSGLIRTYYAPRWQLFFDSLDASLRTGTPPTPIDWYAFGDAWNRAATHFPAEPAGDTYAASLEIARALRLAPGAPQ